MTAPDYQAAADGLDVIDCTGIQTGNTDLRSERGTAKPEPWVPLPVYPRQFARSALHALHDALHADALARIRHMVADSPAYRGKDRRVQG